MSQMSSVCRRVTGHTSLLKGDASKSNLFVSRQWSELTVVAPPSSGHSSFLVASPSAAFDGEVLGSASGVGSKQCGGRLLS